MWKPIAVTWCVLFLFADGAPCEQIASIPMSGEVIPETVPVILDTDIGTDIDDAFALALALASPELELRGVTTVSGDAFTRAMIACRFLDAVGHSRVPVAAGLPPCKVPMLDGQTYQNHGKPELNLWREDIPINHSILGEETARAWNYEKTLQRPYRPVA